MLQSDSTHAFDLLYKRYSGKLYNFVMKISNYDAYRSEEIVQRTFIKIWELRKELNPEKSFHSFIGTIARNMLMNEYNHEVIEYIYRNYIVRKKQEAEISTSSEEKIEYTFLTHYLDTLIDELPSACKEVYRLSRLNAYSNKEIASRLRKSESTVEKQLMKANKFIREKVKQHYDKIFLTLLLCSLC